jgi:lipopolysaccharide transport system ATP-binding protein
MSSQVVISVENLGKVYRIGHQVERQRYVALRDVLAAKAKGLFHPRKRRNGSAPKIEDFWALKDVSFEVKQGDVVGIIGRNGAGKSTLLKVLSRITEPSKGRVRIKGRVASLLEVGTGFHPELTGRENIFLNGAILGMSRAEVKRKFDEIVSFAEVEKFLDTPVKFYSSGMYVRLAFAVAAHLEPEILVVDEVLAVGDAEFQKKCLGKMQDVSNNGRTVLFVSHQLAAIRTLTSRCVLLNRGGIVEDGPTSQVLDAYSSSFAQDGKETSRARPGWATPIIKGVFLKNQLGEITSQIPLGSGCSIEVAIDSTRQRLRKPVLGLVVSSPMHGPIAAVNTRMKRPTVPWEALSQGTLTATFHDLPLIQGRYTIDLWIGDGSQDLDTVPGALVFDIVPDDVYGSGVVPFDTLGPVLLRPDWLMEATC